MSKVKKFLATILTLAMCCSLSLPVAAAGATDANLSKEVFDEGNYEIQPTAVAPGDNIGYAEGYGTNRIQVSMTISQAYSDGIMLRGGVVGGSGTYDCYVTTPGGTTYKLGSSISCNKGQTGYYKTGYASAGTYTFTFYISNSDYVGCLAWAYEPYFY